MRLGSVCLFLTLAPLPRLNAEKWRPISPEELAAKQPVVDANADAEILFRDVRVRQEFLNGQIPHTVWTYYERRKIFTVHGKDNGTIHISDKRGTISDI